MNQPDPALVRAALIRRALTRIENTFSEYDSGKITRSDAFSRLCNPVGVLESAARAWLAKQEASE